MKFFLIAGLAVSGSLANFFEASLLEKRDLAPCSDSYLTDCGSGCIGYLETCCPDKSGGCPVSSVCWLGNNGKYGCCPIGEICDGPGGAITSTIGSPGGTSTVSIPEQPPTTTSTTTTEPPATTEAPPSTTEAPPTTTEAPQPTTTEQSSASLPILTVPSGTAPTSAPAPATSSPPIVAGAATLGLSASTLLGGVLAGVLVLFF